MTGSDITDGIRDLQRKWLLQIAEKNTTTITGVAKKAGLTPTTLTRLMNDPDPPAPAVHRVGQQDLARL
jgi:predicted component of type VI protein secretion system